MNKKRKTAEADMATRQILDRMDAEDVLQLNSRPVVQPFNYGVTAGPWVCINSDSQCEIPLRALKTFGGCKI